MSEYAPKKITHVKDIPNKEFCFLSESNSDFSVW